MTNYVPPCRRAGDPRVKEQLDAAGCHDRTAVTSDHRLVGEVDDDHHYSTMSGQVIRPVPGDEDEGAIDGSPVATTHPLKESHPA